MRRVSRWIVLYLNVNLAMGWRIALKGHNVLTLMCKSRIPGPAMAKDARHYMDPLQAMRIGFDAAKIGFEAQSVIAMRLAGIAGFWNVPENENVRMVQEKPLAVLEAGHAAFTALMNGHSPDRALSASMARIGHHTQSNLARLSKRGPSWF
jgi:hypothetical protein